MAIDNFKYIIMCGGNYDGWEKPRQLSVINGETLVERTIRLLKNNGINNIAISTNNHEFDYIGVPILSHENNYIVKKDKVVNGGWYNAFYPTDEPVCYIFGDVFFSPQAIKTIVETPTDDIELFGSKMPFDKDYIKTHEEPFALKVAKPNHLKQAIEKTRELDKQNKFWRKPIVWELFTVIKDAPLQVRRDEYTTDYIGISDYTCDIDRPNDINKFRIFLGGNMIKLVSLQEFSLGNDPRYTFDKLQNIIRKNPKRADEGKLYEEDIFECDKDMANYLTGGNDKGLIVARVIDVPKPIEETPKEVETPIIEKPIRTIKKKNNKKRAEY